MTGVAILGASGRMGRALVQGLVRGGELRLAGALECAGHPDLGKDAGVLAGSGELGVPVSADFGACAGAADVLIDFSAHEATALHAQAAAGLGKPVVIGTTGLTREESATVRAAAGRIPIVWAPNMSVGVNVLFALVEKAAGVLGPDFDIEVIEAHHRHKKDAPSGTALRLAEIAAARRGLRLEEAAVHGRRGETGARPRGQIGIHAVRAGEIVGDHTVLFAGEGERLELVHRASGREALARGALQAAQWLLDRRPGLYDMQDVLGLRA